MKKLLLILSLLVVGCGKDGDTGPAGPQGASGITITKSANISVDSTDYCPSSNEACYFKGGQIVHFSDGTVLLVGNYAGVLVSNGSEVIDNISVTFLGKANADPWLNLSIYVNRGNGYKPLYMKYFSATDQIKIIHDSDQDYLIEDSDEILYVPTLTYN